MKSQFIFILLQCILLGNYSGGSPGSSFKYGTNAREIALSQSTISTYNPGFNAFNNPGTFNKRSIINLNPWSLLVSRD